jgi:hypothetical protein
MDLFGTAGVGVTDTPGKRMDNGNGNSNDTVKRAKLIAGALFVLLVILHSRKGE